MQSSRQRTGECHRLLLQLRLHRQRARVPASPRSNHHFTKFDWERCDGFPHRLNLNWPAVLQFFAS